MHSQAPNDPDYFRRHAICLDRDASVNRTFLLGNRGGFVVYLPTCRNVLDRTLQSSKWFGASGFGRAFYEETQLWVIHDGRRVALNRTCQTHFIMELDEAIRVYHVGHHEVRERYFVPDGMQVLVMTLETELPWIARPEFDMRYYQTLNQDFSEYRATAAGQILSVQNTVSDVGETHSTVTFFATVGVVGAAASLDMLPDNHWLIDKTYLRDEHRAALIHHAYTETHAAAPDEAPSWELYSTRVLAPATFSVDRGGSLLFAFGDTASESHQTYQSIAETMAESRQKKRETIASVLERGFLETGNQELDSAYVHVLTRFNDSLVAHDATLHVAPQHTEHFYGIFAGNKYFMDAWKRDENIALEALLVTNQWEDARCILDSTWQFQDERTGRLPHIIRAGERLVYYSSDGTLWALLRLLQYTALSGDATLLEAKLPMVERFFAASMDFVQRGLLPSGGIIDKDYLWETWEDTPFTPRDGFPVEIEVLWLSVLERAIPAIRSVNKPLADTMTRTLVTGKKTFSSFIADGYLVDSLSYSWEPRRLLTPNGYVAFGVEYCLPADLADSLVVLARDQLAGHRGVRSLAPRDWPGVLPQDFLADERNVRGKDMASVGIFNYHRGIEWQWFNSFFVQAELDRGDPDEAFRRYVLGQARGALKDSGIGGLSELYALQGSLGADFQAWSMAAFICSVHRFAGMRVDAASGQLWICPSLPASWPFLRCRSRVADHPIAICYEEPSATRRVFTLQWLAEAAAEIEVHLGLRVQDRHRIRETRCNGLEISPDRWSYVAGPTGRPGYAWLVPDLEGDIHLECTIASSPHDSGNA